MALIFSTSFTQLMANVIYQVVSGNVDSSATSTVTVYSGTQPAASDIIANWANYTSAGATYLANFTGIEWQLDPGNTSACTIFQSTAATPVNSGTATWAILWGQAYLADASLASGGAIPTSTFIVVPVSDITGTGIIQFTSAALTAGTPVTIAAGGILTNSNA